MKIISSILLVLPLTVHAGAIEGIKNWIKSKEESSAKNDHKGKCENLAKESGPHEIIRKVDKDRYLAAVTVCKSRNNCSLEDALVLEVETWDFKGRTMLTSDLWVEPTGKRVNVKDENGFDADYALYKESTPCAVKGMTEAYGKNAIAFAAKQGDLRVVKELVKQGQDVNMQDSSGVSVLDIAMEKNQKLVVDYLKSQGAKPGKSDVVKKFVVALTKNDLKTAKDLMRSGFDPNVRFQDTTLLNIVCSYGDLEMVKYFSDHGAKIDEADSSDITPLIVASSNGKKEIVQFLINKGADVNHVADGDRTPASEAKKSGHKDIVKILKSAGADE